MKNESSQGVHTQHLKWAIEFAQRGEGRFGWEGPAQERHRFYEFVRDSNLQGNDLALYHFENLTGTPEEFLKKIDLDRMEEARRKFKALLSELAKEDGSAQLDVKNVTLNLRAFPSFNPYQITIKTDADPVEQALWLHVVHSRQEGDRIRKCENEDCGAIFLREGKKPKTGDRAYCSIYCTRSAVTKRYLENRKAKRDAVKAAQRSVGETVSEKQARGAKWARRKIGRKR